MLEQVLERILAEMVRANEHRGKLVAMFEWQKLRLEERDREEGGVSPAGSAAAPEAPSAEAPEAAAPNAVAMTPSAEPVAETPAVAPPTEELDRDALLVQCRELGIEVPPRTQTRTLYKWVQEGVPQAPSPEEAAAKLLTATEARAILNKEYDGTAPHREMLREALAAVGAERFSDVAEGQFNRVVDTFRELVKAKGA